MPVNLSALAAAFAAGAAAGAAAARLLPPRRPPGRGLEGAEKVVWLQRLSTVGRMMSSVLHEVRTPLNTVILAAENASRRLARGEDAREQLAVVAREAERAVEILSDTLDFAKPAPLDLRPLSLREELEAALQTHALRFSERGVATSLSAPPGLRVRASGRHLQQVLAIVLINALDAMPFGGRLEVEARREGRHAVVRVKDNGVGIEPQVLGALFEPFATTRPEGTGLGLNVARWIMDKHGGDAALASPGIGRGTAVTLTFPALD